VSVGRARRRWAVASSLILILIGAATRDSGGARAALACAPSMRVIQGARGRVDGLYHAPSGGATLALVGASPSGAPFLPRDDLLVLTPDGRVQARIAMPAYMVPPGLAAAVDAPGLVRVIVDESLLIVDASQGRIVTRWPLDVQALGWPAAVAASTQGRLYVAGQPRVGRAAILEAITVPTPAHERPRVIWRVPLGLTHAGLWLDVAGHGLVAAYLPDADDVHGTIALFDERVGALRASYAVPVSPAGADPVHDRAYLDDAGMIRVLTLREGSPVATIAGTGPLALDPAHNLLAFMRGGAVVLASARTLRPLARVPMSDALSLTFASGGHALLVGRRAGLSSIDVGRCAMP